MQVNVPLGQSVREAHQIRVVRCPPLGQGHLGLLECLWIPVRRALPESRINIFYQRLFCFLPEFQEIIFLTNYYEFHMLLLVTKFKYLYNKTNGA